MRHRLATTLAALALALPAGVALAPAGAAPVGPGTLSSPNVEWVGGIPDVAAVSAFFVNDARGKAKWLYLSTLKGLSIYDVSNPVLPLPMGRLTLPHFENEDITGNDSLAIITTSPGGQVFLIDTRNKMKPKLAEMLQTDDGDAHVANCIDDCKRWVYLTEGDALKVLDLDAGADARITTVPYLGSVGPVHDVDQDAEGIVWMTGTYGAGAFAVRPLTKPGTSAAIRAKTRNASPRNPVLIADMRVNGRNRGTDPAINDFILHNSKRPTTAAYKQTPGKPRIAPGGVFLVTEEDYLDTSETPGMCRGAGRFHTMDVTGSTTTGAPLRVLDTWTMSEGTLDPAKGERTAATAFCGAHWFTERKGIVAMGVYGAGTRFLDVTNPRDIKQVGWFFAPDQETWAAYFVPGAGDLVYTVDMERGIDILRLHRGRTGATVRAPAPLRTKTSFLTPRVGSPYAMSCPLIVRSPLG